MHSSKKKESEYKTPLLTNSVQKVYSRLLLEHMKMAPKTNGQFLQRYRSSHKIAPNPELSAFLVKINILTFETNFYGIFFIRSGFKFGCFLYNNVRLHQHLGLLLLISFVKRFDFCKSNFRTYRKLKSLASISARRNLG
ncbi:hypothetical protein LEP1GSC123_2707 [Leptospira borgpetersenii str. 200701203]|uniref:Uncharacterized protein n=1 Tax=Leptospira borgpetersenii str. 200701203 TaxID=1193007 RepID=M3HWY5_LEPBO|nr:hypothetical protein LEP1GSC123_2707 [Leptospira borgpetersenii str. 200701203]